MYCEMVYGLFLRVACVYVLGLQMFVCFNCDVWRDVVWSVLRGLCLKNICFFPVVCCVCVFACLMCLCVFGVI